MTSLFRISLRLFTLLSLVLVVLMVMGTGLVLSQFFRQAILEREGKIIADFTRALSTREIVPADTGNLHDVEARTTLGRRFGALQGLSEIVRVKVYDPSGVVIWSDDAALTGTKGTHVREIGRAAAGAAAVVFRELDDEGARARAAGASGSVVEFYVPILVNAGGGDPPQVGGVVALYRSAASLNATIRRGVFLVWVVTASGGMLLYVALFALFRAVHRSRQEMESRLSRLSSEHQRMVQLEKLSAVGSMVGEIAHQINNPLVGVVSLTQLAERETGGSPRLRALLADIRKAGEHCRDFVQRMLAFTKAARCERQWTAIAPLVAETVALFAHSAPHHPEVALRPPPQDVHLWVDPVLLRHALFNLLSNAAQAAPDQPVEVEVREAERGTPPRAGCVLSVRDRGPGVPSGLKERIFTPFFTTRAGGVGLGLSVVEHIAVQHGGETWVEDAPGGGARFALWLPASAGKDAAA